MKQFKLVIQDLRGNNREIVVSEYSVLKGRIAEEVSEKFPDLETISDYYLVSINPL